MEKTALKQFIDDVLSGKITEALSSTQRYLDLEREQHTRIYRAAWNYGYTHTSVSADNFLPTIFIDEKPLNQDEHGWSIGDWAWVNSNKSTMGTIRQIYNGRAVLDLQKGDVLILRNLFVDEFIRPTSQEIGDYICSIALKKYPKGTKIKCLLSPSNTYVTNEEFSYNHRFNILYARRQDGNLNYILWKDSQWAEVVEDSSVQGETENIHSKLKDIEPSMSNEELSTLVGAINFIKSIVAVKNINALKMLSGVDEYVEFKRFNLPSRAQNILVTAGRIYPCVYEIGKDSYAIIDDTEKISTGWDVGCFSRDNFTLEDYTAQFNTSSN